MLLSIFLFYERGIFRKYKLNMKWSQFYVAFYSKKVLYIIELFAGSYRNIYCRYIKKAKKNLEVRVKVLTFAHAFRERGAVIEKRGIFFGE